MRGWRRRGAGESPQATDGSRSASWVTSRGVGAGDPARSLRTVDPLREVPLVSVPEEVVEGARPEAADVLGHRREGLLPIDEDDRHFLVQQFLDLSVDLLPLLLVGCRVTGC